MSKMRVGLVAAMAAFGALLCASCGSDSGSGGGGGGSPSCNDVCACVVAAGGDNATCQQECADSVAAGGNQKASCEAKLDGWGYSSCKSKCSAFPTG